MHRLPHWGKLVANGGFGIPSFVSGFSSVGLHG
jgi:hypothetical protein